MILKDLTNIRLCQGFEVDLTLDEEKLFSRMSSACRRCIRKAEKEGVHVEEAHDVGFADDYFAQLKMFSRGKVWCLPMALNV